MHEYLLHFVVAYYASKAILEILVASVQLVTMTIETLRAR
jgi:hypothetical protein